MVHGCEHAGPVRVAWLIDQVGDQVTVADVIAKMKCTRCKQRNIKQYSITFAGASMEAMRGADQRR
ncbi:hypothetical protein [Leisingera methylohalidivorans]|uniref:Uncharacterized protein n=1 Tax=Leisingera methylohalidivorans DSM 14336 TaxID=999552 RepID=V9VZT2_9RHOB|nr:hypothetical protein [Leisingera methylohalidivorans]AHD03274.1 hypothetical protein METH_18020 [Leisingera methylohalidivorans DSM 14336]